MEINALHLLWMLPLSLSFGAFFGFILCSLFKVNPPEDEK